MKINFSTILAAALLLVSILLIYYIFASRSYKELYYDNRLETIVYKDKFQKYYEKLASQLYTENACVDDIILIDENRQNISLKHIINETKLIYRFPPEACQSCVEDVINNLKRLGKTIGTQRIILISSYDQVRQAIAFKSSKNLEFSIYNYTGTLDLPIEGDSLSRSSFSFLLDTNLIVDFAYKVDADSRNNKVYYDRIELFYKEGY